MSEGDFLKQVLDVILGHAEIKSFKQAVSVPKIVSRSAFARATLELWNQSVGLILEAKKLMVTDQSIAETIKVTTDKLGNRIGCSGANIRQVYNRHREEMKRMVNENPKDFNNLRHLQSWNLWFVR